ncbi:MAG: winged helix-turn-helix domain-containing protein [Thermoanaerobaculia bacterium]|nr:winged helix-turn-helix domain-containing protein [Thermoanaerobaculia bacterium]
MAIENESQRVSVEGFSAKELSDGHWSPSEARDAELVPLVFGPYVLDLGEQSLTRNGEPCRIQPQPLRILALLASRPGRLVSREELRREVWGEELAVDHEHGLNFAIHQIRSVVEDEARRPRFVETVPRAGYRFVARAEPLDDAGSSASQTFSEPAKPSREEGFDHPGEGRSSRWRYAGSLALLLVMTVAVGFFWGRWSPSESTESRPKIGSMPMPPVRVAVLPFDSAEDDVELATAVTFDLIAELGGAEPGRVEVVGRRSVVQFRKTQLSSSDIGARLSADWLVEGRVERVDRDVRIDTLLVEVGTGVVRAVSSVQRSASELSLGQRYLAEELMALLLPDRTGRTTDTEIGLPVETELYRLFARARWLFYSGGREDARKDAQAGAVELLREVVASDPAFAAAQAELASLLAQSSFGSDQCSVEEAITAAEAALELDPASVEGHFALGLLRAYAQRDLEAGRLELARAVELRPGDAHALSAQAGLAALLGDREAAAEMSDLAVQIDPLAGDTWLDAGFADYLAHRFGHASERCARSIELGTSAPTWAAYCLLNTGQAAKDVELSQRASDLFAELLDLPSEPGHGLMTVREMREQMILRLESRNDRLVLDYLLATHAAALDRPGEALDHLEASLARGDLLLPFALADPLFDGLHEEPRFQRILKAVHDGTAPDSMPSGDCGANRS